MADFFTAYKLTRNEEGFYSNDEGDSGGETVLGLTRNADGDWDGWQLVDKYKEKPNFPDNLNGVRNALDTLAQPYYKRKYWSKMRGDEIVNQEQANRIYDTYVNTGSMGVVLAQRALGITETGTMDEQTINKLNNLA